MTADSDYTFGVDSQASDRLAAIAQFFNPLSAKFVGANCPERVGTAIDLGCGPGYTTDMLRTASGAIRTVGLDRSSQFVCEATSRWPDLTFETCDVTADTLPEKADVLYCRFLLSHLRDPVKQVNRWLGQLNPGGRLLIDELEAVDSRRVVFRLYLSVNMGMIASHGATLCVGRTLASGRYDGKLTYNMASRVRVNDALAARWFLPNAETVWERDPFVLDRTSPQQRGEVRDALRTLASMDDAGAVTLWTMRRIVLTRDETTQAG